MKLFIKSFVLFSITVGLAALIYYYNISKCFWPMNILPTTFIVASCFLFFKNNSKKEKLISFLFLIVLEFLAVFFLSLMFYYDGQDESSIIALCFICVVYYIVPTIISCFICFLKNKKGIEKFNKINTEILLEYMKKEE